jgi:hypothetical protein
MTPDFLDAFAKAGERTRKATLACQLFCLVVLLTMLNSFDGNWASQRIHVAQVAQRLYLCDSPPAWVHLLNPASDKEGAKRVVPLAYMPAQQLNQRVQQWVNACKSDAVVKASEASDEELAAAASFVLQYGFTQEELSGRTAALYAFTDQNLLTTSVPLTGVRIDINDLGIVFASGLFLLLGWLALSYSNEELVLKSALRKADAEVRCYLACSLVFTPTGLDGRLTRIAKVALTLLSIAAGEIVLAAMLWFDSHTGQFLPFLVQDHIRQVVRVEFVFVLVNGAMTGWALNRFIRIQTLVRQVH